MYPNTFRLLVHGRILSLSSPTVKGSRKMIPQNYPRKENVEVTELTRASNKIELRQVLVHCVMSLCDVVYC